MSNEDARAVDAVLAHHAQMRTRLIDLTSSLIEAATATAAPSDLDASCTKARAGLLAFAREELLPHARAEEGSLYAAAAQVPAGQLLVEAMRREHVLLRGLVEDLAGRRGAVEAAATAQALTTLFGAHVDKENDLLLPLLAGTPGVSVVHVLAGMHELIGHDGAATTSSGG